VNHRLLLLAMVGLVGWSGTAAAAGDAAQGEKVFKKCATCHTVEPGKNKIGPSLAGVIGRQAGTLDGYKYSKAMVAYGESGIVWSEDTLNTYLIKPRDEVKGTKMTFPGLKKDDDRANVIAYLMQFSE
jgi:cytochrome c2